MTSDAATARGYLLGELSDERSAVLEQAVLVDRDLLGLVEQVEHDLIDDYVDNRLPAADRVRFEQHYLVSAQHRDRVAVARALLGQERNVTIDAAPAPAVVTSGKDQWFARLARALGVRPRAPGWAATVVVLAIAGAVAVTQWRSAPPDRANVPAIATTPSTPDDRAPATERVAAPMRVAVVLPAISTRSRAETTPRVTVSSEVAFVDLLLEGTQSGLTAAAAEIRSVDDRVVWTGASAPPSLEYTAMPHAALVSVPAGRVPPDDYILTMTGDKQEVLGRYFFRVAAGQ